MSSNFMSWRAGLLCVLFLLVGLPIFADTVPRMSPDELKSHLGDETFVILDVRAGWDWAPATTKIAGAERVDPRAVGSWIGNYPREKTIVLYCA